MNRGQRNIQGIGNHLSNVEDAKVPRWMKVGAGALAAAWWLSPVDDIMLPHLLLADEAVITAVATWMQTDSYRNWRNNRRAKKSTANSHTDQNPHRQLNL